MHAENNRTKIRSSIAAQIALTLLGAGYDRTTKKHPDQ